MRTGLDGTDGCSQDDPAYDAGRVKLPANTVSEQLQRKLPHGLQLKASRIDVNKLTGEDRGWRTQDLDCRPSFDVPFTPELLGDALDVQTMSMPANAE